MGAPDQIKFDFESGGAEKPPAAESQPQKKERKKFPPGSVSPEDFEAIVRQVMDDHPDWGEEYSREYAKAVRGMIQSAAKEHPDDNNPWLQ